MIGSVVVGELPIPGCGPGKGSSRAGHLAYLIRRLAADELMNLRSIQALEQLDPVLLMSLGGRSGLKVGPPWSEVAWGHTMGLGGWRTLRELAQAGLQDGARHDELAQLAYLEKEHSGAASDLVRSLTRHEPELDERPAAKKWLYLLLKRL